MKKNDINRYLIALGFVSAIAVPPAHADSPLPQGVYFITNGGNVVVDGGFGNFGGSPPVETYTPNGGIDQQWIWDGSTFQNADASQPTRFLNEGDDGFATESTPADTWTVASSGSGFTLQNNRTGNFLSLGGTDPASLLPMSFTQTVWILQRVGFSSSVVIDDTDPSILYSNGPGQNWSIGYNPGDFNFDDHFSNLNRATPQPNSQSIMGANMAVNFSGTGITWVGDLGPNIGIAAYSVDGGSIQLVDNYSPTLVVQNPNLVISGLAPGSHTLQIQVTPFNNPASSDLFQVIDAFIIENGGPLAPSQGMVAGFGSPDISFGGDGWICGSYDFNLSGGHCFDNTPGDSMTWTFNGSLIEVYGRIDFENGLFDVVIDGNPVATVDGFSGTVDDDWVNSTQLFAAQVGPGTHTIQLVNTGNKDPSARDTFIQIDAFIAFP